MGHEEEGVVRLLARFVGEGVIDLSLTLQGLVRGCGGAQTADGVLDGTGLDQGCEQLHLFQA
jgi:hypothetical protein